MPVTYCPCPRPILKRPLPPSALEACPPTPHDEHQQFLAIDPSILQPLVRFPPQPALVSSTHPVYSAAAYDRTPIIVSPNQCALPARGCPGRTYALSDAATYAHERARQRYATAQASNQRDHNTARERQRSKPLYARAPMSAGESSESDGEVTPLATSPLTQAPALPPLIPDLSSESEESDGFTSPPLEFGEHHCLDASAHRGGLT